MSKQKPIHVHRLEGCRPTPLAHYLKALGIFRLIAEQADPEVRGWWKDDVFHIATALDKESLEGFFLNDYSPTPILSPWLKGSGFYDECDKGLNPIETSTANRLEGFRQAIFLVREQLVEIERADRAIRAIKDRTKDTRAFQSAAQREYLASSFAYRECCKSINDEIIKIEEGGRTGVEDQGTLTKRLAKLALTLKQVNSIVADPGKQEDDPDLDLRPTKTQIKALKSSEGYKLLLKIAEKRFAILKSDLILDCKQRWRGQLAEWLSAALVLQNDLTTRWPPLLGTGGNDGNLDFTNNSMQCLLELFDMETGDSSADSAQMLKASMFGDNETGYLDAKLGQFAPCATKANPWTYVLMLDGAIYFRAAITRQCSSESLPQASAPFAVRLSSAQLASFTTDDLAGRGEQWMPLWDFPSTSSEISKLFSEGRVSLGREHPQKGSDIARSLAMIGANRGISSFERFGILKRNGDSHYTTPLGKFVCEARPNQKLINAAAPWVDHFRRVAAAKNAPVSFLRAHQACEEAIVACTQRPTGISFLRLLETMGRAEDHFLTSPKHSKENRAEPIPKLPKEWARLIFADLQNDVEVRLAFSLAAQYGPMRSRGKKEMMEIRHHWLPLDGSFFKSSAGGLAMSTTQCANGLDLQRALITIMNRRILEMSSGATAGFIPLTLTDWQFGADVGHIEAFLEHRVDDAKILSIARGLMAVDLSYSKPSDAKSASKDVPNLVDRQDAKSRQPLGGLAVYGLLKLAHQTHKKGVSVGRNQNVIVKCNPTIFRRLQSGDLSKAIELAARQTSIAGLRPRFQIAVGSPTFSKRLAASLAFGIAPPLLSRIALGLTAPELDSKDRRQLATKAEAT